MPLVGASKVDRITTSVTSEGFVFVEVTAGGASGWGEASYNDQVVDTVADKIHEWVAHQALGHKFRTPDDIDAFAERAWNSQYKYTGTVLAQAIAGVDTALWDLMARGRNASCCSLIAERMQSTCKPFVPIYGSNGKRSKRPDDIVAKAVHNRDKYGVQAFKFQVGNRLGATSGHDVDIKPNRTEELIPLARRLLGPSVTLMVDANGGFDNLTHAQRVADLLVKHNYTWFEEPFPFWRYEDTAALMRAVPRIAVAIGEQEYRLDVFERNMRASMRYAQPDVHYVGGVSRALQVAKMTLEQNVTFVPHSPNPSMINVFVLHLLASIPTAFPFMEFDAINTLEPPSGAKFFTEEVYRIHDGAMKVPQGTGWGVTLKPGLLRDATNRTSIP